MDARSKARAKRMAEGMDPCPFCGSKKLKVQHLQTAIILDDDLQVICNRCGARGPLITTFKSEQRAKDAWNSRQPVEEV